MADDKLIQVSHWYTYGQCGIHSRGRRNEEPSFNVDGCHLHCVLSRWQTTEYVHSRSLSRVIERYICLTICNVWQIAICSKLYSSVCYLIREWSAPV